MLRSPSFLWSKSRAYAPQTNQCTIVVSTNPTHAKHLSITDMCAIATLPIFHRSRSPRETRQGPSNEFGASHPKPLPSVVRYRLKAHEKRRQVSVTIAGLVQSKLTRAQSPMGTSECDVATAHGDDELRVDTIDG